MKVGNWKQIFLVLILTLAGYSAASAGISFGVGTDDFYVSVGDYDYLPYAYAGNPGYSAPRISFYDVMGDYGAWVNVSQFGQVWRPYAASGWRPYTYGHWIYTSYGPTWQGYEPWAWAGYHYGNWIFTSNYGWVWIPGYEWHNGRVAWAQGYDSIGWTPLPPNGYDYSRGYLSNVGPVNQFSYYDNDFGVDFGVGGYSYGGPYYDPRYRDLYYNPSFTNINVNLWVFINNNNFVNDNYADYYLGPDYTRQVFDRRLVRISNRQLDKPVLERIVHQKIEDVAVEEKEIQTDKRAIKVVVPTDTQEIERVRRHGKEVVNEVIAPAFAEKQKPFKGERSKNKQEVSKIFHQENTPPRVENLTSDEIINRGRQSKANRDQQRAQRAEAATQEVQRVEKEGKIRGPKNEPKDQGRPKDVTPAQPNTPAQPQIDKKQNNNRPADQQKPENQNPRNPRSDNPSQPLDQPADQPDRSPKDKGKIDDLSKDKDQLDSEPSQRNPNPEAEESTKENSSDQTDKNNQKDSDTKKKSKKNTEKKKKPNPDQDEETPQ